jgi:hypothetical protein
LRAKLLATLMKWNTLEEEPCSLARPVAVIGKSLEPADPARMLFAQAAVRGFRVPADRLKKLVRFGVLRRIPYQESPKRYEYILTQNSLDLYPIIISSTWLTRADGRCCTSTRTAAILIP